MFDFGIVQIPKFLRFLSHGVHLRKRNSSAMRTDNVVFLTPDSPFRTSVPVDEPGVSEHPEVSGLRIADLSNVRRLVELVREHVAASVFEREQLLESDPVTGAYYRSTFRVFLDDATEFEYRNALRIVRFELSPAAKVGVDFEKARAGESPEFSLVVTPREGIQ